MYIVRCESSSQLFITLDYLENLLGNKPEIGVLMIDSISAFYWIDKYAGGDSIQAQESNLTHVASVVEKLARTHNLVVFATKSVLYRKTRQHDHQLSGVHQNSPNVQSYGTPLSEHSIEHYEYLCQAWNKIITQRLMFTKQSQQTLGHHEQHCYSVWFDGNSDKTKLHFTIEKTGVVFLR